MDSEDELRNIDQILINEVYDYDSDSSVSSEVNRDCELIKEEQNNSLVPSLRLLPEYELDLTNSYYFQEQERIIIQNCEDSDLKYALIRNVMLRRTLENTIQKLECQIAADEVEIEKFTSRRFKSRSRRVCVRNRLGIPYFKDDSKFPCPSNSDFKYVRDTKRIIMLNFHMRSWTEDDKIQLARDVYSEICQARIKELHTEIAEQQSNGEFHSELRQLRKSLSVLEDKKFIEKVAKNWKTNTTDDLLNQQREIEIKIERERLIEHYTSDGEVSNSDSYKLLRELTQTLSMFQDELLVVNLVGSWDKKIDWFKISTRKQVMRHSDIECRAMWNYFLNPKFTKARWMNYEREMLINIVDKYHYSNWDAIASELDVKRSPYMCCIYFQTNVCPKIKKEKWNQDEDVRLLEVIESCRIGSKISWSKVSCFFTDRTREQLYKRYRYSLQPNLKKGRFQIEEDILLLTLLKIFDKNHSKLKSYFPNRHIMQIRDRIITLQTDLPRPWTLADDMEIIKHVDVHGMKKWSILMLGRNSDSIRHRYNFLVKWFRDNPNGRLNDVERRQCRTKLERFQEKSHVIETLVTKLLQDVQRADNKNDVLNLEYIKRMLPFVSRSHKTRKQPVKRINFNSENIVDRMLHDFFKTTFSLPGPPKSTFSDEEIGGCADRIEAILKNLDAFLEFPPAEELQNSPYLDEIDKIIIEKLRLKRRRNERNVDFVSLPGSSREDNTLGFENKVVPYKFAPTPDNLIGFRGLMLNLPTVMEHARGYLRCSDLYESVFDIPCVRQYGLKHAFKATESELLELDDDLRTIVLHERGVFEKRMRSLLWWPCMMSNFSYIPLDNTKLFCEDETKQSRKRGRPKKNLSKIQKMCAAKKAKAKLVITKPEYSTETEEEDLLYMSD